MTPRFVVIFVLLFAAMLFGEWLAFFRGYPFDLWTFGNWLLFAVVLVAEAGAILIITLTIDRALPTAGNRALPNDIKQSRRGRQKYPAR